MDTLSPPNGLIEILDRAGRVTQRVPLSALPMTVGRGYDNDVILDDPYVSPLHLRLELGADQALTAVDLDSTNGLYREGEKRPLPCVELSSGKGARIGHTILRYRAPDFAVPDALVDRSGRSLLALFENPLALTLIALCTLISLLFYSFLQTVETVETVKLLANLVFPVLLVLIWSGVWAFASKLISHKLHFFSHCGIASAGVLVFSLFEFGLGYLVFALDMDALERFLLMLGGALIMGLMLYGHLRFCSLAAPLRLAITAAALALTVIGLAVLQTSRHLLDFSQAPRYHAHP